MGLDLFSRSLDVSYTAHVPGRREGRSQTENPLQVTQIHTHMLTHGAAQGSALLWPLYLGLSPSLAALSSENVSPSFSFSLPLFCFSAQVTQDSHSEDKEKQCPPTLLHKHVLQHKSFKCLVDGVWST